MKLGHWLNSLSALDHAILLLVFLLGIYLSKTTLDGLIEYYNKKTNHNKFRVRFRVTPGALLVLGFIYSLVLYQIFSTMFPFMP